MAFSDDLSPLLQKQQEDAPFRQGYMLYYDASTGQNQVEVNGAVLQDLPLLNIGDTINLVGENTAGSGNGSVVILMKMKSSWAIMGRVVIPGNAPLAPGAVLTDFDSQDTRLWYPSGGLDQDVTPTFELFVYTKQFVLPDWANAVSVAGYAAVFAGNTTGGTDSLAVDVRAVGASVATTGIARVPASEYGQAVTYNVAVSTGLSPGFSFQIGCYARTGSGTWTDNTGNFALVRAQVLYYRE